MLEPQNEDELIGSNLIAERFREVFIKLANDEETKRSAQEYQAFCAKRYRCTEVSPLAFMFMGFAFGMGEGMAIAEAIIDASEKQKIENTEE
ncbi:MAG: hypothetical protein IJF33_06735 [Clostridia bacterium]|nr:hypothetical protein [Clostridia bacterium]